MSAILLGERDIHISCWTVKQFVHPSDIFIINRIDRLRVRLSESENKATILEPMDISKN